MGAQTGIEWTDATVNFWWGCTVEFHSVYATSVIRRVGKKRAGHLLDGVQHRELPQWA